jgi:MinD superfamily P-loop ATPase
LMPNSVVVDSNNEISSLLDFNDDDIVEKIPYFGNLIAYVDDRKCIRCGICTKACNYESIFTGDVKEKTCTGCGACVAVCPTKAIELRKMKSADILILKRKKTLLISYEKYTDYMDKSKLLSRLRKIAREKISKEEILIINGIWETQAEIAASLLESDVLLLLVDNDEESIKKFLEILSVSYSFIVKRLVLIASDSGDENTGEIENEIKAFCKAEKLDECIKIGESLENSLKEVLEKTRILKH